MNNKRGAQRKRKPAKSANDQGHEQHVLNIDRVARVVKGGRRFRFRALVVVGDGKGQVGVGSAKGSDVAAAIEKAGKVANRQMIQAVINDPQTIPHEVTAKVGGACILLKSAPNGTGLIAGGITRQILTTAGYQNLYSKSLGNTNKTNLAYAVIEALKQLLPVERWHINQAQGQKQGEKS